MGLPFYVVIRATRRSSGPMQGKGSTFISHWTRPLPLQSSSLPTEQGRNYGGDDNDNVKKQ